MATHVAVMNQGSVEQFGPPRELLDRPATTFVATFLGTPPGNLLPVKRHGDRLMSDGVDLGPATLAKGADEALLFYRAEQVTTIPAADRPNLQAEFSEAAPMAGRVMVTATIGSGPGGRRLSAIVETHPEVRPGDAITLSLAGAPDAVFALSGERIE